MDVGDDTVNSALLVDNIQVTAVPEPLTILAIAYCLSQLGNLFCTTT